MDQPTGGTCKFREKPDWKVKDKKNPGDPVDYVKNHLLEHSFIVGPKSCDEEDNECDIFNFI